MQTGSHVSFRPCKILRKIYQVQSAALNTIVEITWVFSISVCSLDVSLIG